MKQVFSPTQFVATKWDTAEDKAKWANKLVWFIETGCIESRFQKPLYRRLSMCFGHIAHYNQFGFFSEWFLDGGAAWIRHIKNWTVYGDPTYTYSDVERAIQNYARENWS